MMGLRASLDRITQPAQEPDAVVAALDALKTRWPHTVRFVEKATDDVNCFMYAIGIPRHGPVCGTMYYAHHPELGLGKDCLADAVRLLMHFRGLTPLTGEAAGGELVIYSFRGRPRHAGISLGHRRVRSKWGSGFVWEHGLWELPVRYGREVAFSTMVSEEPIRKALLVLAWSRGTLPVYDRPQIQDLATDLGVAFGEPIDGF